MPRLLAPFPFGGQRALLRAPATPSFSPLEKLPWLPFAPPRGSKVQTFTLTAGWGSHFFSSKKSLS